MAPASKRREEMGFTTVSKEWISIRIRNEHTVVADHLPAKRIDESILNQNLQKITLNQKKYYWPFTQKGML